MYNNKFRDVFRQYMYYGIIAVLVIIALVFLPMLDTSGAINWGLPSTTLGWIAYIVIRCLVGVITFMIFCSFDDQGKVNILDDPRYLNALNKLLEAKDEDYKPMSPIKYRIVTRGFKGTTIALSSIVTAFIIVECALSYNYAVLLAYAITILMSLVTGLFQMMKSSDFWTLEFPRWVDYHLDEIEKKKKARSEDNKSSSHEKARTFSELNVKQEAEQQQKEIKTECLSTETKNLEI